LCSQTQYRAGEGLKAKKVLKLKRVIHVVDSARGKPDRTGLAKSDHPGKKRKRNPYCAKGRINQDGNRLGVSNHKGASSQEHCSFQEGWIARVKKQNVKHRESAHKGERCCRGPFCEGKMVQSARVEILEKQTWP